MIQICFDKWYLPNILFPNRQDRDIKKKKKKTLCHPFCRRGNGIFFFSLRGNMMAYFNSWPFFVSVAINRSPWKHYASHSLSGNTRDAEPWRMCEYVSKCVYACACSAFKSVHARVCVCTGMCCMRQQRKDSKERNGEMTSKCPCKIGTSQWSSKHITLI